jgi:tetratricopeptide (TPR) repeat protein
MIDTANQLFALQAYDQAEKAYLTAILEADSLFNCWFDSKRSVSAYLVSHHNLAHLYIKNDRSEEAKILLVEFHLRLNKAFNAQISNGSRLESLKTAIEKNALALNNNFNMAVKSAGFHQQVINPVNLH